MLPQTERDALLGDALARYAGGSWERESVEARRGDDGRAFESRYSQSTSRPFGTLAVQVHLRGDGDVDVSFDVPAHQRERVELHFLLPSGHEPEAIREVAKLVGGFLAERLVLKVAESMRRGAALVPPDELPTPGSRAWCVSWHGTFDQ